MNWIQQYPIHGMMAISPLNLKTKNQQLEKAQDKAEAVWALMWIIHVNRTIIHKR